MEHLGGSDEERGENENWGCALTDLSQCPAQLGFHAGL